MRSICGLLINSSLWSLLCGCFTAYDYIRIVPTAIYRVIRFILPLSMLQMCVQPYYCWEPAKNCVTAWQHLTDQYCCSSGCGLLSNHTEENMDLLLRLTWTNKHPELGLMLSHWRWWGFKSCSMWFCVRWVWRIMVLSSSGFKKSKKMKMTLSVETSQMDSPTTQHTISEHLNPMWVFLTQE